MKTSKLIPTIAAFSALTALSVSAQVDHVPMASTNHTLDSGVLAHTGGSRDLFRADVHVPEAKWLRLFFRDTNLARGSKLQLTSARDGAVQHLDAAGLFDYGMSSAYFNGDRVTLELVAAARSVNNRVAIERVEYGLAHESPDSICGNTDDRQLATDPRIGRVVSGASACTWWLINEFTVLTAGHCSSGATNPTIIGFNIPLSLPDGTYVHPSPDDQYPLDVSSLQQQNAGRGADWAVIAAGRNSNHGMYPGQRQGAWFTLGSVPTAISGVDIRITGNGRVTPPVSMTWNAVTKTHVGPRASTSISNALAYQTDTTGGNSGSPVIHEQTGHAIGIHSHGGCRSTGGRNYGTRIDRPDLQAAIAAVVASVTVGVSDEFGIGCAGSAGVPALAMAGIPDVGSTVSADVTSLPPNQPGAMLVGLSNTTWLGTTLPIDLGVIGLSGCSILVAVEASVPLATSGGGAASYSLALPNDPGAIGVEVFFQFIGGDVGALAVVSNGGRVLIGG